MLGINIPHVLLWGSNPWFIRREIENYVNKHGSSLTNLEGTVRKNAFVQRLDVGRILPDPRPGWAPKEVFSRVWSWKPFREVIAPKAPAGSPVNTVTLSKHEGAFFPGPLMQKIVKAFDEDMFESLAEQHVYMEEFLFQTWADHHRCEAGNGTGHTTVFVKTQSHSKKNPELKYVRVSDVKNTLRNYADVFGIKSIGREKKDFHGTRAYLKQIAPDEL